MAIKRELTRRAVGLAAGGIESDVRGIEDRSRDFCMQTSFSRLIGIASSHGGAVGGVANDAGGRIYARRSTSRAFVRDQA